MLDPFFAHAHVFANYVLKIAGDFIGCCISLKQLECWFDVAVVFIIRSAGNDTYWIPFIPKAAKRNNRLVLRASRSGHSMNFNV